MSCEVNPGPMSQREAALSGAHYRGAVTFRRDLSPDWLSVLACTSEGLNQSGRWRQKQ